MDYAYTAAETFGVMLAGLGVGFILGVMFSNYLNGNKA